MILIAANPFLVLVVMWSTSLSPKLQLNLTPRYFNKLNLSKAFRKKLTTGLVCWQDGYLERTFAGLTIAPEVLLQTDMWFNSSCSSWTILTLLMHCLYTRTLSAYDRIHSLSSSCSPVIWCIYWRWLVIMVSLVAGQEWYCQSCPTASSKYFFFLV